MTGTMSPADIDDTMFLDTKPRMVSCQLVAAEADCLRPGSRVPW